MSLCTALLIIGLFLGGALVILEWKMPGFLMTSIKNGIANGRAYAKKQHEMKERGATHKESFYEFSKGLQRSVTFKPPVIEPLDIEPIYFPKKVKKSRRKSK